MKKILSIALALAMVFCVAAIGTVGAQAENKLTTTWEKGLSKGEISVLKEADGTEYTSATGIGNPWESPTIDVLGAVKSAAGENLEDGADVYVTFDVRIKYADGADTETPVTAKVLLRMVHTFAEGQQDSFAEAYSGTLFAWMGETGTNIMHYFPESVEMTDEWMHFETYLTVDSYELEGAGTGWNLCLDTISDPSAIAALEFKNVGVYDDTYESVGNEPDDPNVPNDPGNEEEPGGEGTAATPRPTAAQQTPFGNLNTPAPSAGATDDGNETEADEQNNSTMILVLCIVGAVVVAAIIIGVVVSKKKKAGENAAEDAQDEKKDE